MSFLQRAKKDGRKFLNPVPTEMAGFGMAVKLLPLYLRNKAEVQPKKPLGPFHTDPAAYAIKPGSGLRVTWFGHSSVLLEVDGARVLIDPVWDERASPFSWAGPKRFFAPTLRLEDLPRLDVVLISHDHYDHLGARTVRDLAKLPCAQNARWVTSPGVGRRLRKFGVRPDAITELDWTESVEVAGLTLTSMPARHFSGRGLHDRFTTLWASFVIEGAAHRVYFGADSGKWDGFAEIAERFGGFDLTMLEIGAYHPLWGSIHLGPDAAAEAYQAMGGAARAGTFMPIHWGLFSLALHAWRQPIERLLERAEANCILFAPVPGVPTEVMPSQPLVSRWWE